MLLTIVVKRYVHVMIRFGCGRMRQNIYFPSGIISSAHIGIRAYLQQLEKDHSHRHVFYQSICFTTNANDLVKQFYQRIEQ